MTTKLSEHPYVRPELMEFVLRMEDKLRRNDHKTSWKKQPIEAHLRLLKIELQEFEVAYEFFGRDEAANELVDIANFAMILFNKLKHENKVQDEQSVST